MDDIELAFRYMSIGICETSMIIIILFI